MLNENIQKLRKSKGLSQQELALKLNVVRQTVSKWERGLSVPDAEMLIALGETLETPISTFLGETVADEEPKDTKALAEKLGVMNCQLASMRDSRRRTARLSFVALGSATVLTLLALGAIGGSYLDWDFSNPEYATAGTLIHGFEWIFVRLAPFALLASIAGTIATRKRV